MVVLDTNIIIDHLRLQDRDAESKLMTLAKARPKEALAISMLTIQELYEGRSTRDAQKEQYLLATISPLRILPYSYDVAKLAGEIARNTDRPIELADAAIAATAILNGCEFVTFNVKDFSGVDNLRLL